MNKISVIIPVYNVEKYIKKCVESVLAQTYSNLEVILVDDGSIDKSGMICDEYAKKDSRVKVVHKQNGGVSSARNIGLDVATGDFFAFVDSDDSICSNMYELLLKLSISEKADVVCCNYKYGKYNNSDTKNIYYYGGVSACEKMFVDDRFFDGISVSPVDKLYKRDLIKSIRFNENCFYAEDILYVTTILCSINKVVKIDDTFYNYIMSDNSLMRSEYRITRASELIAYNECLQLFRDKNLDRLTKVVVPVAFTKYLHHWEECFSRKKVNEFCEKAEVIRVELNKFYKNYKEYLSNRDIAKYYILMASEKLYMAIVNSWRSR